MFIHVVKSGDSLYELAQTYQTTTDRIIEDNGLDTTELVIGQALIITRENFTYVVQPGDTLFEIARRFDITINDLIELNNLTSTNMLIPGVELQIMYDLVDKVPMEINGYVYPNVDMEVLRKTLPYITYLSIFAYLVKPDGSITNINDEALISEAYKYNVAPIMVLANIDQPGQFSSELVSAILKSEEIQDTLLENIIEVMEQKGYYGVDFDFEYIFPEDRERYNAFLQKAAAFLKERGYKVSTAIAPKLSAEQKGTLYEAHDYSAHGRFVDDVIIMTYEWGYIFSEAMPVAPINLVEEVIEYAVTEIPRKKILMGVPNYGYDFLVPQQVGVPADLITNPEGVEIARKENATILFNEVAKSPYFSYFDNGQQREVHFEDARSILAKVQLAIEYDLGGLSYWTLMSYFQQNWTVVDRYIYVIKVIDN